VALKILNPHRNADATAELKFLGEARALARVRHPNVLTIHAVLEEHGRKAICTEYIPGPDLSRVLEEEGPLTAESAVRVGIETCRALQAVHAEGIVHRDVKTSNVLRDRDGRMVLADFGLGVFASRSRPGEGPAEAAGSPAFMSPEQVRGEELDSRTDLYSLGVLLYNMVSGAFPFEADSVEELFRKITLGRPTPLASARSDLPPELVKVIMKALEPRDSRYQTAAEMEAALARCLAGPQAPAAGPRAKGHRILWLLASLALAAVFVGIVARRTRADPTFEMELSATILGSAGTRPVVQGGRFEEDDQLRLELRTDRDLHVYLLEQDSKGRKYLAFPEAGGRGNPLEAGKLHRLPPAGSRHAGGYRSSVEEGPRWWIVIASVERVGPLEDAVPLDGVSPKTGKEGHPRLKPVTVRGLHRRVQEILGREPTEPAADEDDKLLSDEVEDVETEKRKVPVKGRGIWLGKLAFNTRGSHRGGNR
jgi:hypothetical protein